MKKCLVLGGGGFIGTNLVIELKKRGYWVRSVDIKKNEFTASEANETWLGDLRDPAKVSEAMYAPGQTSVLDFANSFDMVFQLAADMGGMGFLATGENDSEIMHNSALINLNVVHFANKFGVKKVFYSSSACIYPIEIQNDTVAAGLKESDAWPAHPESAYGVEKIFSEILYDSYFRNKGLDIRIARFHNVFGEYTTYDGIRAKAPAALCRKVAMAKDGDEIEVWGDGAATRSFLYISECIDGILKLMDSNYTLPINIGSDQLISVNDLAQMIIDISGKDLKIKNVSGVQGVRGRNSDNTLIKQKLNWSPKMPLNLGIKLLYEWVDTQVNK
jgi:nucleoside-diphosphate-sugar epimerase